MGVVKVTFPILPARHCASTLLVVVCLSVYLSVCLLHTSRYCIETAERIELVLAYMLYPRRVLHCVSTFIDREFEFYEFFSFLKFNEFYECNVHLQCLYSYNRSL